MTKYRKGPQRTHKRPTKDRKGALRAKLSFAVFSHTPKHVQRRALQVILATYLPTAAFLFYRAVKKERLQWEGMLPKMT